MLAPDCTTAHSTGSAVLQVVRDMFMGVPEGRGDGGFLGVYAEEPDQVSCLDDLFVGWYGEPSTFGRIPPPRAATPRTECGLLVRRRTRNRAR